MVKHASEMVGSPKFVGFKTYKGWIDPIGDKKRKNSKLAAWEVIVINDYLRTKDEVLGVTGTSVIQKIHIHVCRYNKFKYSYTYLR